MALAQILSRPANRLPAGAYWRYRLLVNGIHYCQDIFFVKKLLLSIR